MGWIDAWAGAVGDCTQAERGESARAHGTSLWYEDHWVVSVVA